MTPNYLMESAEEGHRLRQKTDHAFSRSDLIEAGLTPGMSSIDVGCGIGLVTKIMYEVSGGSITLGIDASAERIREASRDAQTLAQSISFTKADAHQIPVKSDRFDFVWSRFLFEYLPDPELVLKEMIRLARPEGIIAVADLDGQMMGFHPQSAIVSERLQEALVLLKTVGFYPFVGRKLYSMFKHNGIENVKASVIPYQVYCGGLPPKAQNNWRLKLSAALNRLESLQPNRAWQRFSDAMLSDLSREDAFYYSTMILLRGTKPKH